MLGLPVPRRLYDPISHILPFRSQGKPSPTNGDGIARLCSLKQQSGPVTLTRLRQDAPSGSTGSFTFFAQPQSSVMKSHIEERQIGLN
jgi:hypothetical protein